MDTIHAFFFFVRVWYLSVLPISFRVTVLHWGNCMIDTASLKSLWGAGVKESYEFHNCSWYNDKARNTHTQKRVHILWDIFYVKYSIWHLSDQVHCLCPHKHLRHSFTNSWHFQSYQIDQAICQPPRYECINCTKGTRTRNKSFA